MGSILRVLRYEFMALNREKQLASAVGIRIFGAPDSLTWD